MPYRIIKAKKLLILLGFVVGLPLLFMAGCKTLTSTIYQSMDCDQFNIDHIELRTGINIPSVQRNYCELIDSVRSVSFQVLLNTKELEIYSAKYFEWNAPVFTAEGERSDTRWEASLDTSSRALNFNLYYLKDE
ncbi:hypothetical protein N8450_03070 [Schleiferiaceae bacterium]|nr:hypothetical protein [Schleiferiaceae bacterium]MDA9286858.1 hypothetical protein [Schleiferiaceae bacterium]MDC1530330.1 hypothetical protein [Schleiferiaceae bacterium]